MRQCASLLRRQEPSESYHRLFVGVSSEVLLVELQARGDPREKAKLLAKKEMLLFAALLGSASAVARPTKDTIRRHRLLPRQWTTMSLSFNELSSCLVVCFLHTRGISPSGCYSRRQVSPAVVGKSSCCKLITTHDTGTDTIGYAVCGAVTRYR